MLNGNTNQYQSSEIQESKKKPKTEARHAGSDL